VAELEARGVRFHVQRLGAGERVVVFLHGLVMDNLSSWYFTFANPVAGFAEVVLFDLRGHGRSSRPASGYAVADMVADLAAILDGLGLAERRVELVGNSFGGLLALAFALEHPARVSGLCLVDAHISDEGWGGEMKETLSLEGEERDRVIAHSFRHWLGRHSTRKSTRLAETAKALVHGTSLVEDLSSSPPFEEAALAALDVPVLALYGEDSDVRDRGEQLARLLPQCELVLIPGCTHSVIWEATAALRVRLVDWIRRGEAGS